MPRMFDLIRDSQVPANLMQSAARGALTVPPGETIEILVHLALHNKLFGEQARLTLAGWDEAASQGVVADPKTGPEVLGYFVSLENLRTTLVPALAENPSVSHEALEGLAVLGPRSVVEGLWKSARVMNSPRVLRALRSNANLRPGELTEIDQKLAGLEASPADAVSEAEAPDEVVEGAVLKYLEENAAELAAEKDKPFQLIEVAREDAGGDAAAVAVPQASPSPSSLVAGATASAGAAGTSAAAGGGAKSAAGVQAKKKVIPAFEERRDSTLQKISKLGIQGRIALAMRGSKEERSILIRDSTKLVALAVLDSPKVSDGEVEKFALQKNVLQSVLRAIPLKRKYAKNYGIMRNLVFNPRTPIDISLGLMKTLLIHDLKNLSGNKEVSDTIRKLALRMFKQKMEKKD